MKLSLPLIRRAALLSALALTVLFVVLLLNVTATNPTGRRYSSAVPIMAGNSQAIGTDAERILARDLGVPRNEQVDQRQCVCNSPSVTTPSECRVCMAYAQLTSPYRRPDFIGTTFIAESKNSTGLLYTGREINQLGDYVFSARAMNRPLWIYVRVNARVDPEFVSLAESTGGGVVYYFRVDGWTDPTDQIALPGLVISVLAVAFFGLWEIVSRRGAAGSSPTPPPKPAPNNTGGPEDLLARARRKVDDADASQDIRM